jgi:hypothetical protein
LTREQEKEISERFLDFYEDVFLEAQQHGEVRTFRLLARRRGGGLPGRARQGQRQVGQIAQLHTLTLPLPHVPSRATTHTNTMTP